jgi:hypothetical protein
MPPAGERSFLVQIGRTLATSPSSTLGVPKVGLTTFTTYLAARSSQRIDCVRQQIRLHSQDYRPGPAFYQDFMDAVLEGRGANTDELALRRVTSAQSQEARHDHYADLTRHWLALAQLHQPLVPCGNALWRTPSLIVKVRPDFAIRQPDESVWVVKLWLKEDELADDAARGCLRLLDRHMAALIPGGLPVVVDVRREKMHRQTRRPLKRGFDQWLETEAEGMAMLWRNLPAA